MISSRALVLSVLATMLSRTSSLLRAPRTIPAARASVSASHNINSLLLDQPITAFEYSEAESLTVLRVSPTKTTSDFVRNLEADMIRSICVTRVSLGRVVGWGLGPTGTTTVILVAQLLGRVAGWQGGRVGVRLVCGSTAR